MALNYTQKAVEIKEKSDLSSRRGTAIGRLADYIEVLKPLPTILLAFPWYYIRLLR
jgi:hypothetical protein